MLIVLGRLAEFERELIHARTSEGRKRAIAAGVKMGRPPKLDAFQKREALQRLKAGENAAAIGRSYKVYRSIERLATLSPSCSPFMKHARTL
jgi:DNA invertase Pin-like site-specific DNA recombinase